MSFNESQLCQELGFDRSIGELLRWTSDAPIQQAQVWHPDSRELRTIKALSISIKNSELGSEMIDATLDLNQQLPPDYRAFFSTCYASNGEINGDEIVVLRNSQPLEFVHLRQTGAPNYDLSHDAILTRLQDWSSHCQFDVVGADFDSVALQFSVLPANICAFAEEVYKFCPDSVEQGIGLLEEAQNRGLFAEARALCPEISSETLAFFDIAPEDEAEALQFAELEADGSDSGASLKDGIRLLAATLARDKWLFLWWD